MQLVVVCDFPHAHNPGYLQALSQVDLKWPENRLALNKPTRKSFEYIRWDYNAHSFLVVDETEGCMNE
jgi:hypothetical protein